MIPSGVSTGGGSLDAGSSATSGDVRGGNKTFSFAGNTINRAPDFETVAMYAGLAFVGYIIIKKVL